MRERCNRAARSWEPAEVAFCSFMRHDRNRLRHALARAGLEEVRFRFDFEGTKVSVDMTLPVAILAGGLATRLRPITEKIPKALIDVGGRPFIDHQLALLRTHGYTRAVLCIGYLGEMLEQYLGDGARFGMNLTYVKDGPKLLGTGGALRRALRWLGDSFFVLYGDSYLPCNYRSVEEAFQRSTMPALMTVLKNEDRWDTSNVIYREGLVTRYDKKN